MLQGSSLKSSLAGENLSQMNARAVPEMAPSYPATARPVGNFFIVASALLLLKLLLVSQREMATEEYDSFEYARVSLEDLGSILSGVADHAPGASLVMALSRTVGIPYRIFMEVFLATAAFLFLRPLVVWMRLGMAAFAVLYALLLFHPSLIIEMDRAMADPVGFLLWLAGAGGIIEFVAGPRARISWWSLGLAIASFGFAGITRSAEGPIVLVEWRQLRCYPLFYSAGWKAGVGAAQSWPAFAR